MITCRELRVARPDLAGHVILVLEDEPLTAFDIVLRFPTPVPSLSRLIAFR
jgi:hypothetical protein